MSDGQTVYDVDPETGEVLNLPQAEHTVMIGLPLPEVQVKLLESSFKPERQ